jgi:PAS domain S-box-containing protein
MPLGPKGQSMHASRSLPVDPQEPARTLLVAPDGPVEERLARVPAVALRTAEDVDAAEDLFEDVECVVSGWELPDGQADDLLAAVRQADHRLPYLLYEVNQPVAFVESLVSDPFADYLPRDADPDGRLLEGRVRTLASYRRSLAELDLKERLLDRTPLGITVTDPSLSGTPIVYANEGFEAVTGDDRETVLGRNWGFLEGRGADREVVEEIRTAIEEGTPASVELVDFREDDTPYWTRFELAPVGEDGDPDYFFGFQSDVTDRRRAETRGEERGDRLAAIADLLDEAVSEALAGAAAALADEDAAASLSYVDAVLSDVRELARHDEVDERTAVELAAAVEDAWDALPTGDATLAVESDRELAADPELLARGLEHLLANAVQHGSASGPGRVHPQDGDASEGAGRTEAGPVAVTVGAMDDGFYVADDGPGVPKQDRDRVFELGYSRTDEGTGLGLGIVRQVADAHGWSVCVTDSEQDGARFEVRNVEPGTE